MSLNSIPSPYSTQILNERQQLCSLSVQFSPAFHFDITTSVRRVFVALCTLCTLKVCSFSGLKAERTAPPSTSGSSHVTLSIFFCVFFCVRCALKRGMESCYTWKHAIWVGPKIKWCYIDVLILLCCSRKAKWWSVSLFTFGQLFYLLVSDL